MCASASSGDHAAGRVAAMAAGSGFAGASRSPTFTVQGDEPVNGGRCVAGAPRLRARCHAVLGRDELKPGRQAPGCGRTLPPAHVALRAVGSGQVLRGGPPAPRGDAAAGDLSGPEGKAGPLIQVDTGRAERRAAESPAASRSVVGSWPRRRRADHLTLFSGWQRRRGSTKPRQARLGARRGQDATGAARLSGSHDTAS